MSFEETFTENLSLRKALNLAKLGLDKTEADYAHLKEIFEQLTKNHEKLVNDYDRLQKYNQQLQSEKYEAERFLESRIEQLRQLVEQKQREIEDIQIKIIPNLDQDMIRVKLIGEMEGPYQEAMNKKDAQLAETQKRLNECERKLSLTELELEHCKQQRQQEVDELKAYSEAEIARLSSRLDALLSNSEGREKDRQLTRKLRKDVEEARALLQLKDDECAQLRREKDSLREEISQLIVKLSARNNNDTSEKALYKVELFKLEEQIKSKDLELERRALENGKDKETNRQLMRRIEDLQAELERLKNDDSSRIRTIKEMEERMRHSGEDRDQLKSTISKLQRDLANANFNLHEKEQECLKLQQRLAVASKENNSQEFNYHERMEEFEQKKAASTKWAKQQAEFNQTIADLRRENRLIKDRLEEYSRGQGHTQTEERRPSPEPRNPSPPGATIRNPSERVSVLQEKVKILKKKLQDANSKILQLLKDKISQQPEPSSLAVNLEQIPKMYEAKDAALVPLVALNQDIDMEMAALRLGALPPPPPPILLPQRILPPFLPMHPIPTRLPRCSPPRFVDQRAYRPY